MESRKPAWRKWPQRRRAGGCATSKKQAEKQPLDMVIGLDTSFSMDFDDAWSKVTDRTRGAIVVHFGGFISPDLPAFVERMHASGRFVIEDAAHAPGAELNGKRAGSLADAGCFSFYPTKIMTTGEGGMLTTWREDIAKTARSLQNRGRDMNNVGPRLGFNWDVTGDAKTVVCVTAQPRKKFLDADIGAP